MDETFQGGCYCRAVRFEVSDIFDAGYCHCSKCRRLSGAPAIVWASAPTGSFHIIQGSPSMFRSSENWERYFCSTCGGGLFGRYIVAPTNQQNFISFSPFTLDNPEAVRPTVHIWCSSKASYFDTTDKLLRFPEGTISHPSKRPSWRAECPDNAEAAER